MFSSFDVLIYLCFRRLNARSLTPILKLKIFITYDKIIFSFNLLVFSVIYKSVCRLKVIKNMCFLFYLFTDKIRRPIPSSCQGIGATTQNSDSDTMRINYGGARGRGPTIPLQTKRTVQAKASGIDFSDRLRGESGLSGLLCLLL